MSQKKVDNYRAGKYGRSKPPERKESSTNWKSLHGLPSALRWLAGSDFLPTLKLKQKKHLP